MIVALIILIALVVVGAILYIFYRIDLERHPQDTDEPAVAEPEQTSDNDSSECCGMHITCEKDSLLASVSTQIDYYDDEELDRYAGIAPDAYSDTAIEEFRNVLLTLLPTDIAGWARSVQLRGINLPTAVRDELLMIVSEARAKKA